MQRVEAIDLVEKALRIARSFAHALAPPDAQRHPRTLLKHAHAVRRRISIERRVARNLRCDDILLDDTLQFGAVLAARSTRRWGERFPPRTDVPAPRHQRQICVLSPEGGKLELGSAPTMNVAAKLCGRCRNFSHRPTTPRLWRCCASLKFCCKYVAVNCSSHG